MNYDKGNTKENKLEFNTYCIFTKEEKDIKDVIGVIFKDYLNILEKNIE